MISFVSGIIEYIDEETVVIDNNGIGLSVFMPKDELSSLGQGEEIKVYTYLAIKENDMNLFGFLNRDKLDIFKKLIGVSGVGPKGALAIISTCQGDSLYVAIATGDDKALAKAPGIGAKTAQRIVIDLKDKIDLEQIIGEFDETTTVSVSNGVIDDAIMALVALGYSNTEATRAVSKVKVTEDMNDEDVLRNALSFLM